MKSTFFTKIIDTTEIEVKADYNVTIERLKIQQGKCRETDSRHINLEFMCHDDGRFCVCNCSRHKKRREFNRLYSVIGQVETEQDKTKVKIYSLYNRWYHIDQIFTAILFPLLVLSVGIKFYSEYFIEYGFTSVPIFLVIYLLLCIYLFPSKIFKEKRNKTKDLEIMKNEIIKRVKAVDKWED